jgi:hypothetical protein
MPSSVVNHRIVGVKRQVFLKILNKIIRVKPEKTRENPLTMVAGSRNGAGSP